MPKTAAMDGEERPGPPGGAGQQVQRTHLGVLVAGGAGVQLLHYVVCDLLCKAGSREKKAEHIH
eukprot:6621411-Pyramimonas_sp.AAC.1